MKGTDSKSLIGLVGGVALCASLLAGCSSGGGDGPGVGTTANTAVLTTTDFQTGRLATVSLTAPYAVGTNLEDIGSDPVLRVFDGKVDVVNRSDGENVQVIDPAQGFATTAQWSAGNGSNPQDVLVRGTTAFVPRYNEGSADDPFSDLLVMNLTDGSTVGAVDLRPYADTATDPAMLPRPYSVMEVDGLAWVLLQQIDPSFAVYGVGCFVIVDPTSRAVVGAVVLDVQSPNAAVRFGDSIYVAANGQFSIPPTLSGGVVKVDVATRTAELLVDDDDLGSNVSDVAVVSESKGYVVVANVDDDGVPAGTNDVRVFDPRSGAVGSTVYTCPGFLPDIAWNGGSTLVVACQDFTTPGVLLIDTDTDQVVAGPLDTGLPPFSIGFLP
ncbi:MAG: hypothetical protein IPK07_15825 [Deltaproteobacteria bacterium]|jgi:hypothetical protein|nr:hypothetical protein [Deltaproteobacteria bacterium]